MQKTSFWKAGHTPTLFAAFLYFDLSFMVWVLVGPLGLQISKDLGLSPAQKGLMVAMPLLAGALLRIVMGVLVDHLKPKRAGIIGQLIVIAGLLWAWLGSLNSYGSMLVPGALLGGAIADRIGGIRTLLYVYLSASAFLIVASFGFPSGLAALAVFMLAMISLGIGNGAVFQMVPQRFRKEIGVMTGLVGMAGGIGGFYLASSLGYSKQITGSYQLGLTIFAALAAIALTALMMVKAHWRATWGSAAIAMAKV